MFSLSWFTGASAATKRRDEIKTSIISLREQLQLMRKREKLLETQIAAQTDIARKNATSNKSGKSRSSGLGLLHAVEVALHPAAHDGKGERSKYYKLTRSP